MTDVIEHGATLTLNPRRFGNDLVTATPKLASLARWLARNPDEADDLVQETLARAWRFREQFRPGTSLMAWLKCILRNQHLATLRRRRLETAWFEDSPGADQACAADQPGRLMLKQVASAMERLEPKEVAAILLVAFEGRDYGDAADTLGLTRPAFKSHLFRARRRLEREVTALN